MRIVRDWIPETKRRMRRGEVAVVQALIEDTGEIAKAVGRGAQEQSAQ